MSAPKWEVADVLRLTHQDLNLCNLPYIIQKAVRDITICRTSALGGHKSTCSNCGQIAISYNSCRNRHCPKCQFSKTEQWILNRQTDILPVSYFHVVFTLPHVLNPMSKAYPYEVYNLLFKAAWNTINTLARDPRWLGAKTGMIALLHTWGQNLSFHPHLHCIIPQGGWDVHCNKWIYSSHRNFLFPVRVMSQLFRKYFIHELTKARQHKLILWQPDQWKGLIPKLQISSFNVFAKKSFSSPDNVIQYLGRYSHKVAISNHRIINVSKNQITFQYKDYRDDKQKLMSLTPIEFSRRFLQHILPKGFAKIRHFGILANRAKSIYIKNILLFFERRQRTKTTFDPVSFLKSKYNIDIRQCPLCNNGLLLITEVYVKARGDPYITPLQTNQLNIKSIQ